MVRFTDGVHDYMYMVHILLRMSNAIFMGFEQLNSLIDSATMQAMTIDKMSSMP